MTIKRTKARHPSTWAKRRLGPATPKVARARSSDAGDVSSKPMLIGYARVSTVDQNLASQRDALTDAGCAKIFIEQMSGAVADRPTLHDALEFRAQRRYVDRVEARPTGALDEAVDRKHRKPAGTRYRVSQPDRGTRYDDCAGAAGFSHVWGTGRIRAQPDPGAHPSGPRCRAPARAQGRASAETDTRRP